MNQSHSMDTHGNVYTASSVAESNLSLKIPIYQRLFVWAEDQIETLLNDIWDASKKPNEKYYIGIITVVERTDGDDVSWEIVDGQQRLTFLTLLGTQIKKGSDWAKFIHLSGSEAQLRIRYVGRTEDENSVKALFKGEPIQCTNHNMKLFYECFKKFESSHTVENLSKFADYAFSQTAFLISKLSQQYTTFELNTYFEKLNSTGRQLEPEEQIKGKYFAAQAAEWNVLCDFAQSYPRKEQDNGGSAQSKGTGNDQRQSILDILNQYLDTNNSNILREPTTTSTPTLPVRSILSLPVFLLHVLRIALEKGIDLNPRKLLKTFKEHHELVDKAAFMSTMRDYREWLDKNIIHHTEGGLEFWADLLGNSEDELSKRASLCQFQSMLAVSSGEQQLWVLEAYQNRNKEDYGNLQNPEKLLAQLKREDVGRRLKGLSVKEDGAYDFSTILRYPSVNRYWFWRLDYILWELYTLNPDNELFADLNESERAKIKSYQFKTNRSIEHLHPQTSDNSWDETHLHGFGNLAMISASFNSAQGNDGVATKFGRLKDQIAGKESLQSIKLLLMFKAADRNESNWNTGLAKEHGEQMVELLKNEFKNEATGPAVC